jgi:hypothetical protein
MCRSPAICSSVSDVSPPQPPRDPHLCRIPFAHPWQCCPLHAASGHLFPMNSRCQHFLCFLPRARGACPLHRQLQFFPPTAPENPPPPADNRAAAIARSGFVPLSLVAACGFVADCRLPPRSVGAWQNAAAERRGYKAIWALAERGNRAPWLQLLLILGSGEAGGALSDL